MIRSNHEVLHGELFESLCRIFFLQWIEWFVVMSVLFADWSSETSSGNNGEITSWVSDLLWAAANKPKKWGMQLFTQSHFWVWDYMYIYCISVILYVWQLLVSDTLFLSEVQKVKRDYERLSKKHVKQIKEHQRDRDKSHTDLQESSTEIGRLNNKILVS